jgi:hypothetical protein
VHKTTRQDTLPESGKTSAYKAHRDGVAARWADPAVHQTIAGDLALVTYYDQLLTALELSLTQAAQHHDAHTWYLLPTVPGMGTILSLVLLDDSHALARVPRLQDCASSGR